MRILVTGGAGYIGSVTAAQLLARGHEVTVLDNLTLGHRRAVGMGIRLEVGDIDDASLLDSLFRQGEFDGVMHFAAYAHVRVLDFLDNGRRLVHNLGNGSGFSVREVIRTAARVTGREIPCVEVGRRAGDPPVLVASSERIKKELGWSPVYDNLESIVSSAWTWHCRFPEGYGDESAGPGSPSQS